MSKNNYQEWHHFGDVNPLLYHGTFVRHAWSEEEVRESPLLSDDYEVLMITGPADLYMENIVRMALKRVMLSDHADIRDEIVRDAGKKPDSDYEFAYMIAEHKDIEVTVDAAYAACMYPRAEDYYLSVADALAWLQELGIENYGEVPS